MDFEELNELFDDNDEEIIEYINNIRTYEIKSRPNYFDIYNEEEFFNRFRFNKITVRTVILPQIQVSLETDNKRYHELSAENQLLLTLRFYASGSFYITTGDFSGVHKTTAGRIIARVTRALVSLRPNYIKFPSNEIEKREVIAGFYSIANFPNVIGAIDCTHIKIQSPGTENAEFFRNRKGYFSINAQIICDSKNYIMDIVSRWPGSCHDSHIFQNSYICRRFENGEFEDKVLLGDSGYPLKNYLMTPLANPNTQGEMRYNNAHVSTRTVVERTIGIWKRVFPVLSLGMRCNTILIQQIIIATAVLHNIRILHRENEVAPYPDEIINIDDPVVHDAAAALPNNFNFILQKFINYFSQ